MPPSEQPSRGGHSRRRPAERREPADTLLPPDLAAFLQDQTLVCVSHPIDRGTAFVIKAPSPEIESMRGNVPVHLRHELYEHPAAPVIRTVTSIYDQPDRPMRLETFFNVADEQQRADYAALATQENLYLLVYDEKLVHRLTKAVGHLDSEVMTQILARAQEFLAGIPAEEVDFDRAKAAVMEATSL
jgi:hypothetical protein